MTTINSEESYLGRQVRECCESNIDGPGCIRN